MNLMLLLAGLAHAQDAEPIVRTLPTSAPELRLLAGRSDVSVRHSTSGKSRVVVTPIRWSEVCEVRFSGDASVAVAQVFEDEGALDRLEGFTSRHGPAFYGLPVNQETITLTKGEVFSVPAQIETEEGPVTVFDPGFDLRWQPS